MDRIETMSKLKNKLEKLIDKETLLVGIRDCAYDGLFDYRDNCRFTRQMNWYVRNFTVINQARFLVIPILFS